MIPGFVANSTISYSTFSKVQTTEPSIPTDPYWANVVLLI